MSIRTMGKRLLNYNNRKDCLIPSHESDLLGWYKRKENNK